MSKHAMGYLLIDRSHQCGTVSAFYDPISDPLVAN